MVKDVRKAVTLGHRVLMFILCQAEDVLDEGPI